MTSPPDDTKSANQPSEQSDPDKRNDSIESVSTEDKTYTSKLPFSRWWPVFFGALSGLVLRFIFLGKPGGAFAPMGTAFVLFVPLAVGATTVYFAERKAPRSFGYYVAAGFWSNVFFVLGSLVTLIEGLICAVVIVPLFALYGMLGAIVMGVICRMTKWPRQAAYSFFVLPIVLGGVPSTALEETSIRRVSHEVVVDAPAQIVWAQLMRTEGIQPHEIKHGWMYRIGVPLPEQASVRQEGALLIRSLRMGKSIQFEQISSDWRENEHVRWQYRFSPESFPKGALDDHVTIGGRYFDVLDTTYRINAISPTKTRLSSDMAFRVTTEFNWYAKPVGDALVGNFVEVALDLYKARAEKSK